MKLATFEVVTAVGPSAGSGRRSTGGWWICRRPMLLSWSERILDMMRDVWQRCWCPPILWPSLGTGRWSEPPPCGRSRRVRSYPRRIAEERRNLCGEKGET